MVVLVVEVFGIVVVGALLLNSSPVVVGSLGFVVVGSGKRVVVLSSLRVVVSCKRVEMCRVTWMRCSAWATCEVMARNLSSTSAAASSPATPSTWWSLRWRHPAISPPRIYRVHCLLHIYRVTAVVH